MRVRLLLVPAVVVAIVYSCAGSDHFTAGPPDAQFGSNPGNVFPPFDGGKPDGGDAGSLTDGGNCRVPTGPVAVPVETCSGLGGTGQTATFIVASCNDVTISILPEGESCHGVLGGPTNSFTGTCTNTVGNCTANHLPGTILCTLSSTAGCAIQICADLDAGFCPT